MTINITKRFLEARIMNREDHLQLEVLKVGNLRVGTSGVLEETGEVAGACVRKAHLRQLGMEIDPPTPDKLIMFDLGYASEDIVHKRLLSSLKEGEIILREEEYPVEWRTMNGTKVTGRPDMVICSGHSYEGDVKIRHTPIVGIELKSVHSMWTARDVLFKSSPKIANMIQAAHYMWKVGVPWKLIYSSYSMLGQGMVDKGWSSTMFPKQGEPGSEFIEYNDKGGIKNIKQFDVIYDLRFDTHGRLEYRNEVHSGAWTPTIITRDSIQRYFEFVSMMGTTGDLGPRPKAVDIHGDKAGYKDCDYCILAPICDSHEESGYIKWLNEVCKATNIAAEIRKESR